MQINKFWCWWKQNLLVLLLVLTSPHREYKQTDGEYFWYATYPFPWEQRNKNNPAIFSIHDRKEDPPILSFHNGLKFKGLRTSRIQTALSLESPIKPWYLWKCLTDYHRLPHSVWGKHMEFKVKWLTLYMSYVGHLGNVNEALWASVASQGSRRTDPDLPPSVRLRGTQVI